MVNRSRKTILEETNRRAGSEEAEFTEDIKKKGVKENATQETWKTVF